MRPGAIVDGRFEVIHRVASGPMSRVYCAVDRQTGDRVAIKVLLPKASSDIARFRRESELLARFGFPGVVRFIAHGTLADATPYLVADWIEGSTLRQWLVLRGCTLVDAVGVARSAAGIVGMAHRHGIVHRDLKPENLIFAGDDLRQLHILDFGLAREIEADIMLTPTGVALGTPGYMAPEQVRGASIDARTDVFALGCVLYECIAGRPAFPGQTPLARYTKILTWEPPPVAQLDPEVSEELSAIIARMMAKTRAERPDSGDAVAALLADVPVRTTGRRTRATCSDDIPTLVSTVLARPRPLPSQAATVSLSERRTLLREALDSKLGAFGADLDILPDGGVVLRVAAAASPQECAQRATDAARVLRDAEPSSVVTVASGWTTAQDEARTQEQSIDWGADSLHSAMVRRGRREADEVTLDSLTERLVAGTTRTPSGA